MPDLQLFPKDLSLLKSEKFLFTEQRFQLFEKLFESTTNEKGCTLIGPHGVGKSLFAYFLGSYAYINKYILIYMPQLSKWCQKYSSGESSKESAAQYFIENFFFFNNDLLVTQKYKDLSDFILNQGDFKEKYHKFQVDLLEYLSKQDYKVFYIIDEHQE